MTVDEINEQWKKDTVIDMTMLDNGSIDTLKLHSKYLGYLIDAQNEERNSRKEFRKVRKLRTEYYLGQTPKKTLDQYGWEPFLLKILRTDLDLYLGADDILQEFQDQIDRAEQKIKVCDQILRMIKDRNYLVKNAIDWIKFQNGA